MVLRPDGRPDSGLLRQTIGRRSDGAHPVTLMIFDVLHLGGDATLDLPYHERRAPLDDLALDGRIGEPQPRYALMIRAPSWARSLTWG